MGKTQEVPRQNIFWGSLQPEGAKRREFSAENSRPHKICCDGTPIENSGSGLPILNELKLMDEIEYIERESIADGIPYPEF